MKSFVFPYYVSFGKLDSTDGTVEVFLSDKDAKRLERSAFQGGRFRLDEDTDLEDIYEKVHKALYVHELNLLKETPELVADTFDLSEVYERKGRIPEKYFKLYLDELIIGINYPSHLQDLECTIQAKPKQSKFESVTIEESAVEEYLKNPAHQKYVIYTDDGSTLRFVPKKYAGSFTIPATVRKLGRRVFFEHEKITEVIIEEGLTEIPDAAFEGCISIRYIAVPSSVKTIGYNAFSKCYRLAKVDLSEGLLDLDNTAFRFCYDLKELRLPASLPIVNAFICSYDAGIKTLIFAGMNTQIDDHRGGDLSRVIICAQPGSVAEAYAKSHKYKFTALT